VKRDLARYKKHQKRRSVMEYSVLTKMPKNAYVKEKTAQFTIDDEIFIRALVVRTRIGVERLGYDNVCHPNGAAREILVQMSKITCGTDQTLEVFPSEFILRIVRDFLILNWRWSNVSENCTSGWILARKQSDLYHVLTLSELCALIPDKGWDLIFGFKLETMLKGIKAANEGVSRLLKPQDENPLTMIIQTSQPYHGVGVQIANKLNEIRRNLEV
jgi:hypothetical protein